MCKVVYIGVEKALELKPYISQERDICIELLNDKEEETYLREKFTKPYIYYIGANTGCGCGFELEYENFDDLTKEEKKSPQALIDLLNELTQEEDIEFYCCWDGDWNVPIASKIEVDISNISIDNNYLEFNELEFITLKKRANGNKE